MNDQLMDFVEFERFVKPDEDMDPSGLGLGDDLNMGFGFVAGTVPAFMQDPGQAPADRPESSEMSHINGNTLSGSVTGSSSIDPADTLADFRFGRRHDAQSVMIPPPSSQVALPNVGQLLAGEIPSFKYGLHLCRLPSRSRVETQMRFKIVISGAPVESIIHLPPDTIARPKFQLAEPFTPNPAVMDMSIDVVSPSDPTRAILMCSRCMNRERKRAFRKKNIDANEQNHWNNVANRRLPIFNCRELVALSRTKTCELEDLAAPTSGLSFNDSREVELPLRLACYCRHHDARPGFRIVVTLRDSTGQIVGQQISNPVIITDDHKESRPNAQAGAANLSDAMSPTSLEESSETAFSDYSLRKRRRNNEQPLGNGLARNITSPYSSDLAPSRIPSSASLSNMPNTLAGFQTGGPRIQRVIPSQGSVRGGIEVTILGSGFHAGLQVQFGDRSALGVQCWSESTLVCQLPPADSAGPVVVNFQGYPTTSPNIFTYIDDTDSQLIELALQVVGLKMNGQLENAKNIAMKIIGSNGQLPGISEDSLPRSGSASGTQQGSIPLQEVSLQRGSGQSGGQSSGQSGGQSSGQSSGRSSLSPSPSLAPSLLSPISGETNIKDSEKSPSGSAYESVVLQFIRLAHRPNWGQRNAEGQTLLHLAASRGYNVLVQELLAHGAHVLVNSQDGCGMAPLHFAAMNGRRQVVETLLDAGAFGFMTTYSGALATDMCPDLRTRRLLPMARARDDSISSLEPAVHHNRDISASEHFSDFGDDEAGDTQSEDEVEAEPETGLTGLSSRTAHLLSRAIPDKHYLSKFNWDEVARYLKLNRPDDRSDSRSDSDATLAPGASSISTQSISSRKLKRVWRYFKPERSPPPAYDDIYPGESPEKAKVTIPVLVQSIPRSATDYEEQYVNKYTARRKQLRNDRMLFMFWLPVLMLALAYFAHKGQAHMRTDEFRAWIEVWLTRAVFMVSRSDKPPIMRGMPLEGSQCVAT